MYVTRELPREDVKVLIGDNLGAHLSASVLEQCERHNIRYSIVWVPVGT